MGKLSRLSAIALAFFAFWCLAGRSDRAAAQDKKNEQETTELHLLEKDAGATFGDWNVWRYDEGDRSLFLINRKTGYAVYLPWVSKGWINYRTNDGEWYLLRSKGEPEKQDRKFLKIDRFLKKTTSVALETGKYTFQAPTIEDGKKVTQVWNVRVTKDYIDFHNVKNDDRLTIRRNSGEITHNGRSIGGKE